METVCFAFYFSFSHLFVVHLFSFLSHRQLCLRLFSPVGLRLYLRPHVSPLLASSIQPARGFGFLLLASFFPLCLVYVFENCEDVDIIMYVLVFPILFLDSCLLPLCSLCFTVVPFSCRKKNKFKTGKLKRNRDRPGRELFIQGKQWNTGENNQGQD